MTARRAPGERSLVVDVLLTPAELGGEVRLGPADVAIVIDVIRATTTLATLFDGGCERVLVAGDIREARAFAAGQPGAYLLAGEVGGLRPPGFDFGNSPVELAAADVRGREVIFSTTNGTRALHACAQAGAILAGSLRNAQAVSRAALRLALAVSPAEQPAPPADQPRQPPSGETASEARIEPEQNTPRVVIVCSGRLGRPAVDDTLCAGVMLEHLEHLAPALGCALTLLDGAQLARSVAAGASALLEVLRASAAGQAVAKVGLEADLAFCAEVDASESAPQVVGTNAAGLLILERVERPL
ncbi:MAG TPA: 2-phosphosulfolactate phosphatase [Ktedonobacterales bacterium]|nr:2-phosphosulfolactate phosphatase [Ktedonobacterales bacterium]